MSARWISVSTPVPCAGWQAMPTLASTSSVRPSIENGSRRPASSWRATMLASPGRRSAGSSTPNSSPPRRATVSRSPSERSRRWATSSSRRSPRVVAERVVDLLEVVEVDQHHGARRRPRGWPAVIACSMRSRKSVRLGSPVSASCSDWCSFAIAGATAAVDREERQQRAAAAPAGENSAASTTIGERPEQQAGGRGLEEQVVGQVAPELDDALRERDDGRDQRAVDDEEDGRHAEDRDQVLGPNGSDPVSRDVGEEDEDDRGRATETAYCAALKAIFLTGLPLIVSATMLAPIRPASRRRGRRRASARVRSRSRS